MILLTRFWHILNKYYQKAHVLLKTRIMDRNIMTENLQSKQQKSNNTAMMIWQAERETLSHEEGQKPKSIASFTPIFRTHLSSFIAIHYWIGLLYRYPIKADLFSLHISRFVRIVAQSSSLQTCVTSSYVTYRTRPIFFHAWLYQEL